MSEQQNDLGKVVANGARLAGDTLFAPGTSLILDGQVGHGVARVVAGVAARAAIGPVGWLLVAADSYTKTATGAGLLDRMVGRVKARRAARSEQADGSGAGGEGEIEVKPSP